MSSIRVNMIVAFEAVTSVDKNRLLSLLSADPGLVTIEDVNGMTLLHKIAATAGDHADIASILITHGTDINAKDKNNWTALDWADFVINRDIIELLEEAGATYAR